MLDWLLVNGASVDFSYIVRDGDRISVYPRFEAFDIQSVSRVRPTPLRVIRFVLDVYLGKLARYPRLLGFDALYRNDYDDAELARVAGAERRILLTRDRALLKGCFYPTPRKGKINLMSIGFIARGLVPKGLIGVAGNKASMSIVDSAVLNSNFPIRLTCCQATGEMPSIIAIASWSPAACFCSYTHDSSSVL